MEPSKVKERYQALKHQAPSRSLTRCVDLSTPTAPVPHLAVKLGAGIVHLPPWFLVTGCQL